MTVRLTGKTRRVLEAIHTLDQPWGLSICRETGLGSGTVYPTLERLKKAGWIGSRVEASPVAGRPPRTFCHLTLRGQIGAGLEPARGDGGPSVQEAAADDRRYWDCEKAGE